MCTTPLNRVFSLGGVARQEEPDVVVAWMLRRAKDVRDWNQTELAQALGIDRQHITNWKKRGVPPRKHTALADRQSAVKGKNVQRRVQLGGGRLHTKKQKH